MLSKLLTLSGLKILGRIPGVAGAWRKLRALRTLFGTPSFDTDGPAIRAGNRRAAFWLFLFLQCGYLLTSSGRMHTTDEYEAYYMAESLVERGEVSLPPEKRFFGRVAESGAFYAPYGPLLSMVAAPACAVGKSAGELWVGDSKRRESLEWFLTSSVNSTIAAVCVSLFFLLALKLGASIVPALVASLLYAFATPHWHYATTFFSEPLSALLLLASVFLLTNAFIDREERCEMKMSALVAASLPLALSAWSRLTMAIYFPVLALLVFALCGGSARRRLWTTAGFCGAPALSVGAYLAWNALRFGSPFDLGYPPNTEGQLSPTGLDGSLFTGLHGLLLSEGKGLLIIALPAVVSFVLARRFLTRTGLFGTSLLLLPVTAIVFYAKYEHWEGGYCWGPRYLVPSLCFLVLPLAFNDYKMHLLRWVLGSAVVYSVLVQTLGVSVSFMESQVERGYYLDGFSYNPDYSALRETKDLFVHYVSEAFRGNFLTEAEGLGFDYWFCFLYKSGFSGYWLAAVASVIAAVGALSLVMVCLSALGVLRERVAEMADDLPLKSEKKEAMPA